MMAPRTARIRLLAAQNGPLVPEGTVPPLMADLARIREVA